METSPSTEVDSRTTKLSYNWSTVIWLFILTGFPGIPAFFILYYLAIGAPPDGSEHGFVNMVHFATPAAVIVHGGAGILFFLTMPLQFSTAIRVNYNGYHRVAGAIAIASGYVMAITAPWMHQVMSPDSGLPRHLAAYAMGAVMVIGLSLALKAIMRGDTKTHRAWMMRSVAMTLVPVTAELLEIPLGLIFASFEHLHAEVMQLKFSYDRWAGMVINLAIVERKLSNRYKSTTS